MTQKLELSHWNFKLTMLNGQGRWYARKAGRFWQKEGIFLKGQMLELKEKYMMLNTINYFFGCNSRLDTAEKDNKWTEWQAHKNYPNWNATRKRDWEKILGH